MINPLPLPWMLLAFVLAFAGGGVLGELDGSKRTDQRWTARTEKARADAVTAARTIELARFRNMEVAHRANQLEHQRLRAAVLAADRAARGLRDDLAAVRRDLPGDTGAAGLVAVGTCHVLLGSCVDEYRALAEAADDHAADARLCLAGWPGGDQ